MRWRLVAIRLKLKLERGNKAVEVIALVNSGYETLEPEILLPENHANNLGIYSNLPPESIVKEYKLADGSTTKLIRVLKQQK